MSAEMLQRRHEAKEAGIRCAVDGGDASQGFAAGPVPTPSAPAAPSAWIPDAADGTEPIGVGASGEEVGSGEEGLGPWADMAEKGTGKRKRVSFQQLPYTQEPSPPPSPTREPADVVGIEACAQVT